MLGPIAFRIALYGAVGVLGIAVGWLINGWRLEARIANIEATYAKAFANAKEQSLQKQKTLQEQADKIRRDKDVQIRNIRNSLDIALNGLRNRQSLSEQRSSNSSGNGQVAPGCTGAELYRENAEDLIREAARAEAVREGLNACYQQYDSIREVLNSKKGK